MSFKIAIASGKGGTGKTTISVNLAHFLYKHISKSTILADCDVEEPNDLLFLPEHDKVNEKIINQLLPKIDINKCTFCRKCVEYCEYNAIVVIPPVKFAEVNKSLCHSCGACIVACPENAMPEKPHKIGILNTYKSNAEFNLIEGKLEIGSTMQTQLIKELKKNVSSEYDILIYDAPPGTSCPVVETVSDTDYVILVTEPTPFGLYDLKLTVNLLRDIKIPFGVIINKSGLGFNATYQYLKSENIEILGEVPFNKEYASLYATGDLLKEIPENMEEIYLEIVDNIVANMDIYERDNSTKW